MFSRKRQAKPLKAAPMKFINQGENLDVANSIMSVEMSGNKAPKTPKVSRRKASTMSSQRRSASIERIFEKQKSAEDKIKIELQKQLQELRQKEQELKSQAKAPAPKAFIPPPPPPPPPAKKACIPPPPPPPPPMALKPRKIAPGKEVKPEQKKAKNSSAPVFQIEQNDILNIRAKLRKVNKEAPKPPVVETSDIQNEVVALLKNKFSQMRKQIAESSSDSESDESSEEEF